jgi:biotin operon repressor
MSEPSDDYIQDLAHRALSLFRIWEESEQALSRETLCKQLGCGDRALRWAVRELRCQGYLIVAEPGGSGYRFAREREEVDAYTASLTSRIRALREVVDAMRSSAVQEFGPRQEVMF